ncbi:MAG: CBS domain-containing protein [Phycisphaerae bacterium]
MELTGTFALLAVAPGPGLLFGLMLLAAIVGGFVARNLHIPRVIGYLAGGMALRAVLGAVIEPLEGGAQALADAAKPLSAVNDLALGMILFTIGRVFERSALRASGPRVVRIGLLESAAVLVFVFIGCSLITLLTQSEHGTGQNIVLALLLGLAGIATAPAATLFVLQEYQAKGPITKTILGLVGLNNIICIVMFNVAFLCLAAAGAIDTPPAFGQHLWLSAAATVAGSIVLGILCGTVLSLAHAKLPLAETNLIFFAMFIVLGAGEKWLIAHAGLSFNGLLTALVIGAVFFNVAVDSQKLSTALQTVAAPIFAGFFVIAGFNLHLAELADLGWVGSTYVLCRLAGKWLGARAGVVLAGESQRVGTGVGQSLLCQAAVVIGLSAFVQNNWNSELADQFATVILGSVVVFEVLGPLLLKRCVVRGGEVKAITLLRRPGPGSGPDSVVRATWHALGRMLGLGDGTEPSATEPMQAKHVMRSNVQFLPAKTPLDEVLHFIERSTYDHFPVVDEHGDFVGVIHFSDIREVIYDPAMRELVTALDLADPESVVVPVDAPLDDCLKRFARANVGLLAVVAEAGSRNVVGVLEQRDVLKALHQQSAADE